MERYQAIHNGNFFKSTGLDWMVLKNQENKVINLYSVYSYDLNM